MVTAWNFLPLDTNPCVTSEGIGASSDKPTSMKKILLAVLLCGWIFGVCAQMDTERVSTELINWIEESNYPGLVIYVKKGEKTMMYEAFGHSDLEKKIPMAKEQRFRIFSMTKPITSYAMLRCLSQNDLTTEHDIQSVFPAFDADYPIDLQSIMTHTAGFSYGGEFSWQGFQYWLYDPLEKSDNLEEFVDRLSGLPLSYEPGTGWEYSLSHDMLGAIIEKSGGMPLLEYLGREVLGPLEMKSTGFVYKKSDSQLLSLAPFYRYDRDAGQSVLLEDDHRFDKKISSGGGGLYSTAGDYMLFLDHVMSDSMGRLLRTNQLPEGVANISEGIYADSGYGYGVAVKLSDDESPLPKGSFYWAGLGGTIFWVDPVNDIKVVAMMQLAGGRGLMEEKIIPLVYDSMNLN